MAERRSASQAESSKDAKKNETQTVDWRPVTDPVLRKKIQNQLAQRRFRERAKQKKEESERQAENENQARAAYSTAEPHEVKSPAESGLPWGGISMEHILANAKEKQRHTSSQGKSTNPNPSQT